MKLLFVTEFFPEKLSESFTGGVESRTFQTIARLQAHHKVSVVSRTKKLIVPSLSSVFGRLGFMVRATLETIKRKPELVEGSNFICYLPAFFGAKLTGAKAVAWYPDVYGKTWFQTTSFPVALLGFVLERLSLILPWDNVIAMSQTTKSKLVSSGIDPDRIEVVYGGVDLESIEKMSTGGKFSKPTICTTARLVPYKHIDDLIRAFALVKSSIRHAQLIIMGDGPQRQTLEILATKLGVSASVQFSGALNHQEVLTNMKRSHVFSLPSSVEGFGLASIEAAACGLPYVSSDIPATREITREATGGYLYPVGDYQTLAEKIITLLTNDKIYETKKQESLKLAQSYDWRTIITQTEAVYQSA